jgi:hypothetical protein
MQKLFVRRRAEEARLRSRGGAARPTGEACATGTAPPAVPALDSEQPGMTTTASATREITTTAPLRRAWEIGTPLSPVGFYPSWGPLPEVQAVHDQTGGWDAPGQTRLLQLSGGGSVRETIVRVDAPSLFIYDLTDFRGPLERIVSGGRAAWRYIPDGQGTRVRWRYTFTARPGAGVIIRGIVRFAWGPYMTRVLGGIGAELDRVGAAH